MSYDENHDLEDGDARWNVTGILNVTGRLLKGALVGGIAGLCGGFVLITVVGTLFGYGPLLGLYYLNMLIYYFVPMGMLLGAVVSVFRAARQGNVRLRVVSGAWVGLLLLCLLVLAVMPHLLIGEQRTVTHGATWWIETERADCATPVVILLLYEYSHYEEVCSTAVLDSLQAETSAAIPISYVVTYDFGEPRGYHLSSVSAVEIDHYPMWLGGGDNCGKDPFPTCDSAQAQNDRMLYESSWVDHES